MSGLWNQQVEETNMQEVKSTVEPGSRDASLVDAA